MTAISPSDKTRNPAQEPDPQQQENPKPASLKREYQDQTGEWRPRGSRRWIGPVAAAIFLIVWFVARTYTSGRPLDAETLLASLVGLAALLLAMLVGLLAYGSRSLRYQLDAQGLTVAWLWMRETVPLAGIQAIYRGTRLGKKVRVRGIAWPGHQVGTVEAEEIGPVKFFGATGDPAATIVIATADRAYALTPADLDGFRGRLIELLEALPEDAVAQPEAALPAPPWERVSPLELRRSFIWTAWIALGAALLWAVLAIPVDVPDAHSSSGASSIAEANDWASAGQSLRTSRDGLDRIDVALSTLKQTDTANLQFYVREDVGDVNLRSLRVALDRLPEGKAMDLYKVRWQDLPWVSFEFEPLYGYSGKPLYFNIEGKDIQRANTVEILFTSRDSYKGGEGYTSEKPADRNMVFRAYTRGTMSDLLGLTFTELARGRPGLLGQKWLYGGLAATTFGLVIALGTSVVGLQTGSIPNPATGIARRRQS